MTTTPSRILVGTASWSDPGFVERWYPKGMPAGERLAWYSQHFEMVEVNSTFYAVPEPRMVQRWSAQTPDNFTFDVKLHQLLSRHSTPAKLLPPKLQREIRTDEKGRVKLTPEIEGVVLNIFLQSVDILRQKGKLGALLLQLSPSFSPRKHKLEELDQLIDATRNYRVAIEFRNRNWVTPDQLATTRDFMARHKLIFVNVDSPVSDHFTIIPSDLNEITNPEVAYLRLHGRDVKAYTTGKTVAARFNYDYRDEEVEQIAERTEALARANDVHVVFNNNALDYAPRAALRLRKALGQMVTTPPQTLELF